MEANEPLEHYQWNDAPVGSQQDLADELADIMIYAFQFAQATDIDITGAIESKLQKAAAKYPVTDFKGKSAQQKRKNWIKAKVRHNENKEGL